MSPTGHTIRQSVEEAVRRVRRDGLLAVGLAVGALIPVTLLLAWAWGPGGRMVRGAGPLLLLALGLAAAVALSVVLARRWVRGVDDAAVAAAAERRRGLPQGSLRGVLELGRELPAGASAGLFHRSETDVAARLAGADTRDVAGDVGDRARTRRWRAAAVAGSLAVLTVLAAFASPERARGSWAPLLSPVATLSGPSLPPLSVLPGDAEVPRGRALDVTVEAPYRDRVVVRWRATGDVPRAQTLSLEAGRGSVSLGAVDAPLEYWVEAPDGASTARFRVRPVDPLLVSGLTIEVRYPAHVGREPDTYAGEPPPLRIPEGSRIRIRGAATRPLEDVRLVREDGREVSAETEAATFGVDWTPDVEDSGRWEWRLSGAGASSEATPPAALDLSIQPDLAPTVRITVPSADTAMPASFRQQVVADASDDFGVAAAALIFQRVTAAGERGPERAAPLRLDVGADRLLLRTVLDASGESLVPGDAIHYRVVVRDNSPRRQAASSAEHVLRLASMAELRDRAREEAGEALEEAERVAERTRDLQTATRDLSRQAAGKSWERRSGSESSRPSEPSRLDFDAASQANEVLENHQELLDEMAALERRMAELQEAVDQAGLRDPELQRRLEELRELYSELADPELAAALEKLREGVDELDPQAVRDALQRLAEQQEAVRERMEQSLALLRRAAAEQEMGALAREAEEIATQQDALANAMREELPEGERAAGADTQPRDSAGTPALHPPGAQPPQETARPGEQPTPPAPPTTRPGQPQPQTPQAQPPTPQSQAGQPESGQQPESGRPQSTGPEQRAKQQEELGERTQKLNESMKSLQAQLFQIGEQEAAQQTGSAQQKGQSAQQAQEQAAQQARQAQGQQASESGARAASQLGEAARQLESAREAMAEGSQQAMQRATQQATQEALSLAQREEALRQQMEQAQQQGSGQQGEMMQQMRSEQAALQQGLQQLGQNLSEAGQQAGTVNRDVAQSLARAMLNMQQTMQGMQDGQMPVQQAGQTVESLNQLAMSLLQNEGQMAQQAGSPMQQAMQQLSQAAQEQASLNGQAGALAPMDLSRQAMQQQMQHMAQQQRSVARRVGTVSEQLGGQENVLGRLDQLSMEAEALARELEGGRMDPEVRARQERLFNRLLDAGRSLEREEYNDERVGESGRGVDAGAPPALDPALLDPSLRYPAPTAESLRALPPAYRRLILEYFDRLNRAGQGTAAPPAPSGGSGS